MTLAQVGGSMFFADPPPEMTAAQSDAIVGFARALARLSPLRIVEHVFFLAGATPVFYSSCPVPVISGSHRLYPKSCCRACVMTLKDGVERLLDELRFDAGRPAGAAPAAGAWRDLPLDFGSDETWPDLPYDSGAPAARYDAGVSTGLRGVLGAAAERMAVQAPAARGFVGQQLDRVLLRRSGRLAGAASGSNRACIGRCILSDLHLEADPVAIAIESLVHESIHQRIYRLEAAEGDFCDLGGPSVLRSPWTGSRLPLHSLVHASFVWFGLAMLWTRFGRDPNAVARLAHCRFGFQCLGDVVDAPSFPRASVRREVLDGMRTLRAEVLRAAHSSPVLQAPAEVSA